MDLNKLDMELNVKIIESLKEVLKDKRVNIAFDIPNGDLLEGSLIILDDNNFKLVKKILINVVDDLNPKYLKIFKKRYLNKTNGMNHPQIIDYIKKHTTLLSLLRPFLGKKIIKNELKTIYFRINYNNVIIDVKKEDYDRLNYYTKYIYKLQQLQKLNKLLKINHVYNVVFDDDKAAQDMYNSMYDNLGDILKPRNNI
jgi:hypothetical protein